MGGDESGDLLQVDASANVVEIKEHCLDEEGEVRAMPLDAPIATEAAAPLAVVPPVEPLAPELSVRASALVPRRFGPRPVAAREARLPRSAGRGPVSHQGAVG